MRMKPAPAFSVLIAMTLLLPAAAGAASAQSPISSPSDNPGTPKAAESQTPAPAASTVTPSPSARRPIAVSQQFISAVTNNLDLTLEEPEEQGPPPPAASIIDLEPANNAEIIRLPGVTVVGERPPVFRERDLYSPDELRRLALQRYRGLRVFPFAFLNNLNKPIAEQIYREDERLQNIQSLNQAAANAAAAGDTGSAEQIRQATITTYKRDFPAWQSRVQESAQPR